MIYFILAEEVNRIKIGYAGFDPDKRIAELQVGSPVKLSRIALMHGDFKKEGELHRRFHEFWVMGEWFDSVVPITEYITKNGIKWVTGQPNVLTPESIRRERAEHKKAVRDATRKAEREARKPICMEVMKNFMETYD